MCCDYELLDNLVRILDDLKHYTDMDFKELNDIAKDYLNLDEYKLVKKFIPNLTKGVNYV